MSFRKPAENKIGGKFLAIGLPASGKSYFGLTFLNSACIDSECGLAFYENKNIEINGKKYNNIKLIDTTANLDDLEEAINSIIEGDLEGIDTLVIDSETKFYVSMDIGATEVEEKKARQKNKEVDTRAKWGRVKQISVKLQQAKISASAKGINIVSVAQAKELIDDKTGKLLGYAPEAHKSLPFDYDVVLRFYTEKDTKTDGYRYFAEVDKDRTGITKKGQIIENCTYDIWKNALDIRVGEGLKDTNYSKDLKSSINSTLGEAELQEELGAEALVLIKAFDKNKSSELREKMKELEIELKDLKVTPTNSLKELLKFLKSE